MVIVSYFLTTSPPGKPQIKFWFIGGHLLTKHLLSSKHKRNKSNDQFFLFWCLATISRFHLRQHSPYKIPELIFVIITDISFQYSQLDTGYFPRGRFLNHSVSELIPSMEVIHAQHEPWLLWRVRGHWAPCPLQLLFGHSSAPSCRCVFVSSLLCPAKPHPPHFSISLTTVIVLPPLSLKFTFIF